MGDDDELKSKLTLFELPIVVGSSISFVLCSWLLCYSLPKVPARVARRLLVRQLAYLARADTVTGVLGIVASILNIGVFHWSAVDFFCNGCHYSVWAFWLWAFNTSNLVETHMALGICANAKRMNRFLNHLRSSLRWLWLVALAVASGDVVLTYGFYDAEIGVCDWRARWGQEQLSLSAPFSVMVGALCLATNGVAYITLNCVQVCTPEKMGPKSVELRIQKQMLRYLLIALLTWLPFCAVWVVGHTPKLLWAATPLQMLSCLPFSLNGTMNVWAYAAHNRHLRKLWGDADSIMWELVERNSSPDTNMDSLAASFGVCFDGLVDVYDPVDEYNPMRARSRMTGATGGTGSFDHTGPFAASHTPQSSFDTGSEPTRIASTIPSPRHRAL